MSKPDHKVTIREELKPLDDRIADAFEAALSSAEISDLLAEVDQTSSAAQATSKAAQARALDPKLRPADVDAARQQMSDADFRAKRMDAAAAQLKDLLAKATAREASEERAREYAAAKAERDQLAEDLVAYQEHAGAIVALLNRLAASRERIKAVNASGSSAETWLYSAEKIARAPNAGPGFDFGNQYDSSLPDLTDGVRLPHFLKDPNRIGGFAWPPNSY
jgi:hypothetical protein